MSEGLDPTWRLATCPLLPSSVNEAASETGAAASEVLTADDDLSHPSEKLRTDANTFLDLIRAA